MTDLSSLYINLDTPTNSPFKTTLLRFICAKVSRIGYSHNRVDPAPGFLPLCDDSYLKQLKKNWLHQKSEQTNSVAEKAISELEDELLREELDQSPLLVIATTRDLI